MSFGLPYGVKEKGSDGKLRSVNTMNGERYVYYDRLYTDAKNDDDWRRKLWVKANSVLDWRINYGSNPQNISGYFAHLADYEFAKERALLETHFKTSYDPNSPLCGQKLIEAYNSILGAREIFERNALLIANTKGQKDLVSFFPHYLDKGLEIWLSQRDFSKDINDLAISGVIEGKDKSEKIAVAIEKTINDNIYEITSIALERMFSEETEAENGLKKKVGESEFNRLGKAYKEIFDALKKLDREAKDNEFIRGTIKNYKLDELGQMITNSFKGKRLTKSNIEKSMKGFKFETRIKSKQGILAGGFKEIFGIFNAQVTLSNNGTKVDGIHTGKRDVQADQKADMVLMIGFDDGAAEAAEQKLNEFQGTGRGSNVGDIKRFTQEMFEDFGNDKGFMIMINSKNYTLNWHFRNGYMDKDGNQLSAGGYSAGSPINLVAWDDMMHKMNIHGRDFIFTIMQLIPGAIGNPSGGNEKLEQVSDMFARAIGSALFDDFEPEDPYLNNKKSDLRTIHLLYLNGVYVPLSVFYTLLSEAFGNLQEGLNRNELIKVEFNLPDNILYPTQDDQKGVDKPWGVQSNAALTAITVSYHFLSGFQKFMQTFYKLP